MICCADMTEGLKSLNAFAMAVYASVRAWDNAS